MARVKKGDLVKVIAGKEKGKSGKILEVLTDRVRVEGLMPIKRHLKPGRSQKNPQGGIIERNGTIHTSNVMPVDPKTKRPTRVSSKTLGDGKKVRIAASGETLA